MDELVRSADIQAGVTLEHARVDELAEKAASDLEWQPLCEALARRAAGPCAAERLLKLSPALSPVDARLRATVSREALDALREGEPLVAVGVEDVAALIERARRLGSLSGEELRSVATALSAARELRHFVNARRERYPALFAELHTDPRLSVIEQEIQHAIEPSGRVADAASHELRRARHAVFDARKQLHESLRKAMVTHAEVLRESGPVERDGRFGLPVRADAHRAVSGIVLGASATSATIYIEPPELTLVTNRVRLAEASVASEEERILRLLTSRIAMEADSACEAFEAVVRADVLASIARFGRDIDGVVLTVDDADGLDIYGMRHPLLCERRLDGGGEVVPNDVRLRSRTGLIVSGPNAGGKTVALKCLGLAALMARAGLPIPAEARSRIGFIEPVLTDVGDRQSLERSLSTFSAHIAAYAAILAAACPGALVVLDEICGSTDPEEGSALAVALLEQLVERGAAVAVTTHYERLKHLAADDARFANAAVGFDFERMSPTFALRHGVQGASAALAAAARHGLPASVVARAAELVPQESLRRDQLLGEIESEARAMRMARVDAERERTLTEALRLELERERVDVRAKERRKLDGEAAELKGAIRSAREKLRRLDLSLAVDARSAATTLGTRATERLIDEAAKVVSIGSAMAHAAREPAPGTVRDRTLDGGALRAGMSVWVARLGQIATVLDAPERGEVRVQAGAFALRVAVSELALAASEPSRAKAERAREPTRSANRGGAQGAGQGRNKAASRSAAHDDAGLAAVPDAILRTSTNTCDLRGMRVDEAIECLDRFIDAALLERESVSFALHGHGTGALRNAVREHLALSPHIESRRPASFEEGGDAFTVFWLRG
ncbi:MAG: endonuclease MutS2 [Myxococcales bacterium]|nr:endonuclease MutS2 [Myxococcales bacterium]